MGEGADVLSMAPVDTFTMLAGSSRKVNLGFM
jgi:hypothetical protein